MQKDGKPELGDDSKRILQDILLTLTISREKIKEAMVFSINHSEQSYQISTLIISALEAHKENPSNYIAILYLISDILHNCNAVDIQYAWMYRSNFEILLPKGFEILKNITKTQKSWGRYIISECLRVLKVWNTKNIYDSKYLLGLESILLYEPRACTGNQFFNVYREILNLCDIHFLQIKCKTSGINSIGEKSDLIARIICLQDYKLMNLGQESIEIATVEMDINDNKGLSCEKMIDQLETYFSSEFSTEDNFEGKILTDQDIEFINKILHKYPHVYVLN